MENIQVVFGASEHDRVVQHAGDLLQAYRVDTGYDYICYRPNTPKDRLVPEDLAVTLLVNSRADWRAFRSLQRNADSVALSSLSQKPLERTTLEERRQVAGMIATMATWPGFASSLATKVLHKKRPDLIPILDNQAIYGAYMNPRWPQQTAPSDSIKDGAPILRALSFIAYDLTRAENRSSWAQLQAIEPDRTLVQIFDSVWWGYFREIQPVAGRAAKV